MKYLEGSVSIPKVYVIILHWNEINYTLACLASLTKCEYKNKKIVVIDNGSTDNSTERISMQYPGVTVIRNEYNEGFCKGNNIGINYALANGADYVWLLNNDTEVEPKTLTRLVLKAEGTREIGLVSPVIHYLGDKRRIQFSGSYIDLKTFEVHYPKCKTSPPEIFQIGPTVILWGTALLIKKSVIEKIGLLDERFFAYWEDTDYSIRSIKSGFRNVVCTDARVYHKRSITSKGEEPKNSDFYYYFFERNRFLVKLKYAKTKLIRALITIRELANVSSHAPWWPKEHVEIALTGLWHGVLGISGGFKTKPAIPSFLGQLIIKMSKIHPVFLANLFTLNFGAIHRVISRHLNIR